MIPSSHAVAEFAVSPADEGYDVLERSVALLVASLDDRPLFAADLPGEAPWEAFLAHLPKDRRQHYKCNCCRRFVARYGGLVRIDPETGAAVPLFWYEALAQAAPFFAPAVRALERMVRGVDVAGVFYDGEKTWGIPRTRDPKRRVVWTHLAGVPPKAFKHPLLTASQMAADKREDFGIVRRALADYPKEAADQALRVLQADLLGRAEKILGPARWFAELHASVAGRKGRARDNLIWLAVAQAPPGWAKIRQSMAATVLDDVVAGLPFAEIERRFREKMHPLQYQRPQAAPKAGAIARAEKIVAEMGLAPALERRFATLADVLAFAWRPPAATPPAGEPAKGVFGHLTPKGERPTIREVELPEQRSTWEKFARDVLPDAAEVEVWLPGAPSNFYGLVTAVHAEAPPLLQWDGLVAEDGGPLPRNPVGQYVWHGGSYPSQWGLSPGWAEATAVFLSPSRWQRPELMRHHGRKAHFALRGAKDSRRAGLALFPETLRAELHEVRAVIEAHSKSGELAGQEAADANGLAFEEKGAATVKVRVRTRSTGVRTFVLDRWD